MCLDANKANPLVGRHRIRPDSKGRIKGWKCYEITNRRLYSICQCTAFSVRNGWLVSNRKHKTAGADPLDMDYGGTVEINRGIHVCLTKKEAETWNRHSCDNRVVVPVYGYKSSLVAVESFNLSPCAVFMRVFLYKKDYDKAVGR